MSTASLVDWLPADAVNLAAESACLVTLPEGPRLMVLAHDAGACRLLGANDRCTAYESRPLDCRLYPFVVERDDERRVTRLSLFDANGCGDRAAERHDFARWERADAERAAELEEYAVLVARWNRFARHRSRLGHRARGAEEFLEFTGVSNRSEKG